MSEGAAESWSDSASSDWSARSADVQRDVIRTNHAAELSLSQVLAPMIRRPSAGSHDSHHGSKDSMESART